MTIYDHTITTLGGDTLSLADYRGKYLLLVNVASECGYTPQYEDLQAFYTQYADRVVVIGFPSNQFGGQEPGTDAQIAQFCERKYGVAFPVATKADVKGAHKQSLYAWLTDAAQNGSNDTEPAWNFHKYLVSPEGQLLKSLPSNVNPFDEEILNVVDPA